MEFKWSRIIYNYYTTIFIPSYFGLIIIDCLSQLNH